MDTTTPFGAPEPAWADSYTTPEPGRLGRLSNALFDALLARVRRRAWVAGTDPTAVTRYTWRRGRVEVVLLASWGVEATVHVGRRTWRTYDARLAQWVFGGLEAAHDRREAAYDDDPMGRAGDYV